MQGFGALSVSIFTQMTPPPGSTGGLLNAIVGSLIITALGVAIGAPLGHSRRHLYGRVRTLLRSSPSSCASSTTFCSARPRSSSDCSSMRSWWRESAISPATPAPSRSPLSSFRSSCAPPRTCCCWCPILCARPRARSACRVRTSSARSPIAPPAPASSPASFWRSPASAARPRRLLFTALNNQFFSTDLNAPMASLPVVIFQFALSPYKDWQRLAWAGALIITLAVLALSITARALGAQRTPK